MHVIILCGGSGTRLSDYSLPKPLNMIHGVPSISHCLRNIPSEVTTLHFIVAPHLAKFNFEEIVKNLFKQKKCIIHWLPYFSRGPIESAWLGTVDFPETDESIVFLDNDVVYSFPPGFFSTSNSAFLGYAKDTTGSEAYSFLTIKDTYIMQIKEKKRISDDFCCGVYGFKNITQFRELAKDIMNSPVKCELYMSTIYELCIQKGISVKSIFFEGDIYHIGSLKELKSSWNILDKKKMRVCFDLDNTLVTYPDIPGDYTTVRPITKMIEIARKMKAEGHTIIIHTARRMETHKNNVGAVIRDIGLLTFNTLETFNIPYDELLFGKPIADIYIDDRAVNPYRESIDSMGYIHEETIKPMNMLSGNKYNTISVYNDSVKKSGPTEFMRGEINFYEHIPRDSAITSYFPLYRGSHKGVDLSHLTIEYIKGVSFYTLFKNTLISEHHLRQLCEFMDILHSAPGEIPSVEDMKANYIDKLKRRFEVKNDYPFSDAEEIQSMCLNRLDSYIPSGVGIIHGDLWFSNVLIDFSGSIKCIDMKGQVNGKLTLGGDKLYDYGKIYQSLLGYDAILYGDIIPELYRKKMVAIFLCEIQKRSICIKDITAIAISLIIGTLHSIDTIDAKQRVWEFIRSLIYDSASYM